MIENLKYTFNQLIDFTAKINRKHYEFSLYFIILAYIFSGLITFCIYYLGIKTFGPNFNSYNDLTINLLDAITLNKEGFFSLFTSLMLLAISMYSIYVGEGFLNTAEKINIKGFFRYFNSKMWNNFALLIACLCVLYFCSYKSLVDILGDKHAPDMFSDIFGYESLSFKNRFLGWVDGIVDLVRFYAGYIFCFILIIIFLGDKLNKQTIKKYIYAGLIAWIFSVVLLRAYSELNYIASTIIIDFIRLIFNDEISSVVLKLAVMLALQAAFFPLIAAAFYFPFLYEDSKTYDENKTEEEEHLPEYPDIE